MSNPITPDFSVSDEYAVRDEDRVVIHHLSDVHYERRVGDTRTGVAAFNAYTNYLYRLEPIRRPELIIFTGDLTETGKPEELKLVAALIGNAFAYSASERKNHIFVVPGPYDLDWEKSRPGFEAFGDAFKEYGLPKFDGEISPAHEEPGKKYLIQLLDTCYGLEGLPNSMPDNLARELKNLPGNYKQLIQHFKESLRQRNPQKPGSKPKLDPRKKFLDLIEDTFISLDTGAIRKKNVDAFIEYLGKQRAETIAAALAAQVAASAPPASTTQPVVAAQPTSAREPLRILVTHHPLITPKENKIFEGDLVGKFSDIVSAAREHRFHLALHGHLHEPQLLTDFSFIGDSDSSRVSLRQFGAGSLAEDFTFNEIVATRSEEKPNWQLYVQTQKLKEDSSTSVFSLAVLDAEERQTRLLVAKQESEDLKTRRKFDQEIRQVMHLFAEATAKPGEQVIPRQPMQKVQEIIEQVIFRGIPIHVGLAIKRRKEDKTASNNVEVTFTLENDYINPHHGDPGYLHEFRYPTTAAAWALILGRPLLVIPGVSTGNFLKDDDLEWLAQSGKVARVRGVIEESLSRAKLEEGKIDSNSSNSFQMNQLRKLTQRLGDLRTGFSKDEVTFESAYQMPTKEEAKVPFISVPIPLRTEDNSSNLVEVGVLNIDALSTEEMGKPPAEWKKANPDEVFTPERIEMLKTLSDIIYVILTEASAKDKPRGSWEEPKSPFGRR